MFMRRNMVKGGNDIFPQKFNWHQKKELRHGMNTYLDGKTGLRDY